jgi:hypothetical protein
MSVSISETRAVDIGSKEAEALKLREEAYELARLGHERLRDAEAKLAVVEAEAEKLAIGRAEAEAAKARFEALYAEIMAIAGGAE